VRVLVDQAAQDGFSADLLCVDAGHRGAGSVRFVVGDALRYALVRPGCVVVRLVVGQDGAQDPLHGGRCHGDAEFRQFAVDPAVSPQRIPLRQANDEAGDARDCRRAAGLASSARVVLSRGRFAVPGQQRRGRNGEDVGPAPAGKESCRSTSSSASFVRSLRNTRTARPSSGPTSR
jgi:hypothetical protein